MNKRDPLSHCPNEILAVYLIVNGSLNMSSGKLGSQCFQAAQRLFAVVHHKGADLELATLIKDWERQGTRTITRIALTEAVFERACKELPGVAMVDEGLTEVPENSTTVFATWPIKREKLPRMLCHRKVPLLTAPMNIA